MDLAWTTNGRTTDKSSGGFNKEDKSRCSANASKKVYKKIKYRRYRMAFTTEQINHLESAFKKGPYVNSGQRQEIAQALGISDRCVKVWFQNRRMREKQLNKEQEEEVLNQGKEAVVSSASVVSKPVREETRSSESLKMPPHTCISNIPSASNVNIVKEERIATNIPFRPNYYQDISPSRAEPTTPMYTRISPAATYHTNTISSDYKASAEFSIDLCKKFEPMLNGSQNERKFAVDHLKNEQQVSHSIKRKIEPLKSELQDAPEDLSMKRFKSLKNQSEIIKPQDNHGVLPIYVNFPQPFIGDRNMMWNQLTIPSVIPNSVPGTSISIVPPESTAVPSTYYVPKENCNCCKCPKNNGYNQINNQHIEPKYIINVVPYQNFPKY